MLCRLIALTYYLLFKKIESFLYLIHHEGQEGHEEKIVRRRLDNKAAPPQERNQKKSIWSRPGCFKLHVLQALHGEINKIMNIYSILIGMVQGRGGEKNQWRSCTGQEDAGP